MNNILKYQLFTVGLPLIGIVQCQQLKHCTLRTQMFVRSASATIAPDQQMSQTTELMTSRKQGARHDLQARLRKRTKFENKMDARIESARNWKYGTKLQARFKYCYGVQINKDTLSAEMVDLVDWHCTVYSRQPCFSSQDTCAVNI